uniref:BED-type domain-containing protein n=1 Tax=Lactuca sativa TaxID=4236 RepID=A0A9R1W8B1_LACSA|nr:hypothetical protein LSAT_V11C300112840 [Lactuca sativa]
MPRLSVGEARISPRVECGRGPYLPDSGVWGEARISRLAECGQGPYLPECGRGPYLLAERCMLAWYEVLWGNSVSFVLTVFSFGFSTLCGKMVSGGITRLKQHLTHTSGQVTGYPNVTVDIQKKVMESIKEKDNIQKEKKRNIGILRSYTVDLSDEDEDGEFVVHEVSSKRNVSKKIMGASNVQGPLDIIYQTNHGKKKKQSILDKSMPAPSYHNICVTLMKKTFRSTTRKTAFYDAQSMTRADREHAFERALKIDVSFPKYEA